MSTQEGLFKTFIIWGTKFRKIHDRGIFSWLSTWIFFVVNYPLSESITWV